MIRWSLLRNYPIIIGQKRLGLLQSIRLDEAQKRVCALIVARGMLGKCAVLTKDVLSLNEKFILVKCFQRNRCSEEQPPSLFVRDSQGLLTGRITDYAIDEADFRIIAIQMQTGYAWFHPQERFWVYTYVRSSLEASEICIPACLGSELIV